MTTLREVERLLSEVVADLDGCTWECERCGTSDPIRDLDLATPARAALKLVRSLASVSSEPEPWRGDAIRWFTQLGEVCRSASAGVDTMADTAGLAVWAVTLLTKGGATNTPPGFSWLAAKERTAGCARPGCHTSIATSDPDPVLCGPCQETRRALSTCLRCGGPVPAIPEAIPHTREDCITFLAAEVERLRNEREEAARECLVPIPPVGSDAGKLLVANSLLRAEVSRLRSSPPAPSDATLRERVEALAKEWEEEAERLCQRGDYRDGVLAALAGDLRSALAASGQGESEHIWKWNPFQGTYWCSACRRYAAHSRAPHVSSPPPPEAA